MSQNTYSVSLFVKNIYLEKRLDGTRGIPHFSRICFTPLCSHKRPALVPVFVDQKKSKEDFRFCKNSVQCLLCSEHYRGSTHSEQWRSTKLLPQDYTQHLSIKPP